MNLESQVCSLELSRRLNELGVKQESLYFWSLCQECVKEYEIEGIQVTPELGDSGHGDKWSAFTVAEVGVMLPYKIKDHYLMIEKCFSNIWHISYMEAEVSIQDVLHKTNNELLGNALAEMLLYLIENKLMELPK